MFFSGNKDKAKKEKKNYHTAAKSKSNEQKNTRKIAFCYAVVTPSRTKKEILKNEMAKYREIIDSSESIDNALDSIQKLIPDSFQQLIPAATLESIADLIQDLQSEEDILQSDLMDKDSNISEYFFIAAFLILEAKIYAYEKFPPSEATDSLTEQFMNFPEIGEKIFSAEPIPVKFPEYGLIPAEDSEKIKGRSLSLIENLLNAPNPPQPGLNK